METPKWVRPAIFGGVIGAICLGVVGFAGAGWMTAGKANVASSDRAAADVVAALLPICIFQAEADPKYTARLTSLKGQSQAYMRSQAVEGWGWATMPGSDRANSRVSVACAKSLIG